MKPTLAIAPGTLDCVSACGTFDGVDFVDNCESPIGLSHHNTNIFFQFPKIKHYFSMT
jgi:hypothetical protein